MQALVKSFLRMGLFCLLVTGFLPLPGFVQSSTAEEVDPQFAEMADRCFTSVRAGVSNHPDTVYCDLLIRQLAGKLSREPAEDRLLAAAYNNRAVSWTRSREYGQAEADIEEAVGLQPEFAELYLTRGNLRLQQNRYAEALEQYALAIDLSAGAIRGVWVNRALAYRGQGNLRAANADFERALAELLPPEIRPPDIAVPLADEFP